MPPDAQNDDLDRRIYVLLEEPAPPNVWVVLGLGMCLGALLPVISWLVYLWWR